MTRQVVFLGHTVRVGGASSFRATSWHHRITQMLHEPASSQVLQEAHYEAYKIFEAG